MRKNLISKAAVLALAAALVLPATAYAAPAVTAPVEMSVTKDGKNHKVVVFGQSLALVSTDGSIEISNMGPVGRVDVMIDGVVTKNVASIDIPAGQQTRMVLDENSIIVKNVTAESGEAVKKQISDAYASGAVSIDLASLSNVTAYKIDADGQVVNASGKAVSSNAIGVSVSSTDAAFVAFATEISEITARVAEQAVSQASPAITVKASQSSKVDSASGSENQGGGSSEGGSGSEGEEGGGSGSGSEGEEGGGSGSGSEGEEGGGSGSGSEGEEGGGSGSGSEGEEGGGSGSGSEGEEGGESDGDENGAE